jgi:type I restriction enzyme M protein
MAKTDKLADSVLENNLELTLSAMEIEDIASGKKILDFVSGRVIPATPEEVESTQPISRQLVEDYGYPREHISTRPQHRVKARPSDIGKEYPVDIAIFSDAKKREEDLYIVVEAKRNGSKPEDTPDRQLFNYLRFSSAQIGIWTNGEERQYFRKVVRDNQIDFEQIPNLPRFGEQIDSIGKYRRENLIPPRNLSLTFKAIRNHLAGNTVGTTRDEILATQLINIVFCKIFDEKFKAPNDLVDFRAQIGENPEEIKVRILNLFSNVKAKYADVFDMTDEISLDAKSLAWVVGELQPFCLIEAARDAVGEAFEIFIGATLKGGQGQFFTPRNVVQLMVEIANPRPSDLVIDPACGPGGFLVESLRHKWAALTIEAEKLGWSQSALAEEKTSSAIKTINGIEKDSFLAKVAKAYMAIMGDGKGGIFCEDSLDDPKNWQVNTQQHVLLGRFDVVLANPPFGADIKVTGYEKLIQFELGHKYVKGTQTNKLVETQNPQVLFVERCIQLAKSGGKVGLILPETYFHAPSTRQVTEIMMRHNILALIDLPHNTFRPFNNAKCVAIILEKDMPQQENILMVTAEEMGHNHQGKPIFKYDHLNHNLSEELWDDINSALLEVRGEKEPEFTFEVNANQVKESGILIPRYYWPRLNDEIFDQSDKSIQWLTIRELIEKGIVLEKSGHGSPPSHFKGKGQYPYIRVKDIISWEIYRNPTSMIPESEFRRLTKSYPLEFEDLVYVSRGSYRIGDVAIVGPDDTLVALTREIRILRLNGENELGLTPYYLLYLLSTMPVLRQTKARVFIDTTLPNIADRYLDIKLPFHADKEMRDAISSRVKSVVTSKWSAMQGIRELLEELRPDDLQSVYDLDDLEEDSTSPN